MNHLLIRPKETSSFHFVKRGDRATRADPVAVLSQFCRHPRPVHFTQCPVMEDM